MTPQEIFDTAVGGVLKQNAFSREARSTRCKYRGPNGLKCAVGFLIDDQTAVYFDGIGGIAEIADELPEHLRPHIPLLTELQMLHDDATNIPNFKADTERLASRMNLNWNFA